MDMILKFLMAVLMAVMRTVRMMAVMGMINDE